MTSDLVLLHHHFLGGKNGNFVNSTNHETQTQASVAALLPPLLESLVPSISSTKTVRSNNWPSPPSTPTLKGVEFKACFSVLLMLLLFIFLFFYFLFFIYFFFLRFIFKRKVRNWETRSNHGSQNREVWPRFSWVPIFLP